MTQDFFLSQKGQSLLEVILALALFALIATAFGSLAMGGFGALVRGDELAQAGYMAQEGMEAVHAIRNQGWNELKYQESGVEAQADTWAFKGEGTFDVVGKYTRRIFFAQVCRDASSQLTACPGAYADMHSKKVTVQVEWETRSGQFQTIAREMYLTNWASNGWNEDTESDFSDGISDGAEISPDLGDGDGSVILQGL